MSFSVFLFTVAANVVAISLVLGLEALWEAAHDAYYRHRRERRLKEF